MRQTPGRLTVTKSAKRKPPSRIKYEEANPTVSCRVPREVYEELQAAKGSEGFSFADVLKVGMGLLEVKASEEADLLEQGHRQGYAKAKRRYLVAYRCSTCNGLVEMESEEGKRAAAEYMTRSGWGHRACHEKKQKGLAQVRR